MPPTLAVAGSLAERGHDVRFLAHARAGDRVPFPLTAFTTVPDLYERTPVPPDDVWWDELFLAEEAGAELVAALAREPADAVVIDCLLWGALAAAERLGVPAAVLVHSVYGRRFAAEDRPDRRERLNRTRAAFGLDPVSSLLEPWDRAEVVLVASARCLDRPPEPLPPNVVYAGPLRPAAEPAPALPRRPDLVVSFSTARFTVPRATQRVLDAIAGLPLRCLVTSRADGLRPGPNTTVLPWVPHEEVLPGASLAITHGGHGTVTAALAHGVPLLCLPLVADQPFVARCVEEAGAGLSLPHAAPPGEIRAAAREILAQPAYTAAARRLAAGIREELDAAAYVRALEALVA